MRRDIHIRKKKKITLNKENKKFLYLIFALSVFLIICFIIYFYFLQTTLLANHFESDSLKFSYLNEEIPFSIKKIILFSSATANSNSINQQLTLDISQYCDIGIHLNNTLATDTLINSLYIDNITISSPEIGTPYLYKKNISDLGKCSFNKDNIINESFSFNIVDSSQNIDYSNFELYNNASTPITFGFYNENIKTDFFTNDSEVLYNGLLLKDAMIPLSSLNCNISFRINIITNSNEHYICNMNFDIPLENSDNSIYDTGYITKEIESNEINKFIRIK